MKNDDLPAALRKVNDYFFNEAYHTAWQLLKAQPNPVNLQEKEQHARLEGWILLALGETERAYALFQRSSRHPGAREGILILTVLAGQISLAMTHWQRYCQSLNSPPRTLIDAEWYAEPVARAAIAMLQSYPFSPKSALEGAAVLYCALLHRAIYDFPGAFRELSKVAAHFPPADLLREIWLADVVCLPPPSRQPVLAQPASSSARTRGEASLLDSPERAVQTATRLLLYHPSPGRLERGYLAALQDGRWQEALELLRRRLLLEPDHTPSLEQRWRLHFKLGDREATRADLFALVELYEKASQVAACRRAARALVARFPDDEQALLKVCFLQARLGLPLELARYGRRLLKLCRKLGLDQRYATYRRWLLRQELSLDDRSDFESQSFQQTHM